MAAFALRLWRRKTVLVVWFVALARAAPGAEPGQLPSSPELSTATIIAALTNASQILELSQEQANASLPVRILGMVTCYDSRTVLFVQDKTAGVFVYHTGNPLPLRVGQYVRVTGVTASGHFSPIIDTPVIEPMEKGPSISPQQVSLAQIYLGGLDAQWVEVSGVVRAQEVSESRLRLELADPPHHISVWIPSYQGYEQLSLDGSLVRARGVVGIGTTNKEDLAGFQIFATTLADITLLQPSRADPFSTPPHQVKDLKTHYVRSGAAGRIRVQGVVTLRGPGRVLFLQDRTGGLEVHAREPLDDLTPGIMVDVAGYLMPIFEGPLLEDAVIRKLETTAAQHSVRLRPEDLSHSFGDRQLVEIEAQFLGRAPTSSNGLALALQAGNHFLYAQLEAPRPQAALDELKPGCLLRLTGVCRFEATVPGADHAVTLLLRSPLDVKVIGPPPSTPRVGLQALAAAAILTSIGLAMALLFIQRQRRETERLLQFQATLQADMLQGEQQLRRSTEERERIARDMHDDIIQSIYAVGLNLEDCQRVAHQSHAELQPRLATAIQTLNTTIRSVRGFITGLEPKVLNGREFKTALKSLALISSDGSTQFQIEVDPAGQSCLTSTQATQLLHIAKEAMSNSLRHAHASNIMVSLRLVGAGARLEIRDDGAGFNPSTADGPGHGLRNMNARAREIGAELQIISLPGQGCRVLVTVPHLTSHELA